MPEMGHPTSKRTRFGPMYWNTGTKMPGTPRTKQANQRLYWCMASILATNGRVQQPGRAVFENRRALEKSYAGSGVLQRLVRTIDQFSQTSQNHLHYAIDKQRFWRYPPSRCAAVRGATLRVHQNLSNATWLLPQLTLSFFIHRPVCIAGFSQERKLIFVPNSSIGTKTVQLRVHTWYS